MASHDRALVQVRHLAPDHRAPPGITRVVLLGHARISDLIPAPEFSPQALDQLDVPLVVRARAAALDEQDLPTTCHGDPPHPLGDDPNRYSLLAGVHAGGKQVSAKAMTTPAANIRLCRCSLYRRSLLGITVDLSGQR